MKKESFSRLIALATSVSGGLTVQFFMREPSIAMLTFVALLLTSLLLIARGFPVVIALDHSARRMLGFEKCYADQEFASKVIVSATHSTQRLDIMLIRGHTFILDQDSLLDRMLVDTQNLRIRILLLDPQGLSMQTYIDKISLNGAKKHQYLEKCSLVADQLESLKKTYELDYALYDFFPSWKLIITDSTLFVAAYDTMQRGSRLYVASYHDMGKPYFIAFSNYFEQVWTKFSINRKNYKQLRGTS